MAHTFDFAVLRLVPDNARGESVNLGVVVFRDGEIDVRLGKVLTRARMLFPEITDTDLESAVGILSRLGSVALSSRERHSALSSVGAFSLGDLGSFTVNDERPESYQSQIDMLLATFVVAPRSAIVRAKGPSRLATEVRKFSATRRCSPLSATLEPSLSIRSLRNGPYRAAQHSS
ncbi:DUF3037 domain-containing protein [Bradyrhizobium sp. U531]|uniref:DUF3037 domain-containing protein n=1 Tax=Bradyrhizobium sp. U531 TaxID=3053458 RepID=UPI003F68665A